LRLYRRIANIRDPNLLVFDEGSGTTRISSGAFSLDNDGCSTFLKSLMYRASLNVSAPLITPEKNVVILITVEAVSGRASACDEIPGPAWDWSEAYFRNSIPKMYSL
jgi:hypothetical protein